ncbi:MAG TPA: CBS domain-containing protein [Methanoregulaceae archaeon]|nr:CBS domain-containing protein [Methanoregulaceae archaeon]
MNASDVMTSPVFIVAPGENVSYARNLMLKHKISRLPVLEAEKLIGIITKKDIGYKLRQTEPVWRRRPIDHIPVHVLMTPDPISIPPDATIKEIAAMMIEGDISGLPVIENGTLIGIVTKSDLLRSSHIGRLSTRVADIMEDAITVSRYHSLDHVIDIMRERDDKVVVVNNDGTLAGLITESNLAFYMYANEKAELPIKDIKILRRQESAGRKVFRYVFEASTVAEDLMSRPVITVSPETSVSDAVQLMRSHCINSLVVTEGKDIKGIMKRDDIIKGVAQ